MIFTASDCKNSLFTIKKQFSFKRGSEKRKNVFEKRARISECNLLQDFDWKWRLFEKRSFGSFRRAKKISSNCRRRSFRTDDATQTYFNDKLSSIRKLWFTRCLVESWKWSFELFGTFLEITFLLNKNSHTFARELGMELKNMKRFGKSAILTHRRYWKWQKMGKVKKFHSF